MLIRSAINSSVQLRAPSHEGARSFRRRFPIQRHPQLLRLKLDARKAPLDAVVVDSAEKAPTEN